MSAAMDSPRPAVTLTVPTLDPGADSLEWAVALVKAGFYVLPTRAADPKHAGSRLGKGWPSKSSADVETVVSWFAGSDDRLAIHCGRSGIVGVDIDHPDKIPDELARAITHEAPPFQSTRPDEPARGHYLFAQPPGRRIGNQTGKLGKAFGEIRGANGIILVGGVGREFLQTGRVPELPAYVADLLPDVGDTEATVSNGELARFARLHTMAREPRALEGIVKRFAQQATAGSRHDALVSVACWAVREMITGRFTAADGFARLTDEFAALMAQPRGTERVLAPGAARMEAYSAIAWAVAQEWSPGSAGPALAPVVALPSASASSGLGLQRASVVDRTSDLLPAAPEVVEAELVEPERSSWAPVDLGPYLRGEVKKAQPAIGIHRSDGVRLFYPGKEHAIIGEMESGKSWLSLQCVAVELLAGNRVLYIHFEEDDPGDTVTRLLLLGVTGEQMQAGLSFIGPATPVTYDVLDQLTAMRPTLVILDGQNEAMALHSQGIREEDGAAAYRRLLVKPFTSAGAAVVSCDHVVKDSEKNGQGYALGTIHKGNGITGSIVLLENEEAFGIGRRGASRVYVTKDRPAQVRQHGKPTAIPRKFFMGVLAVDATTPMLELTFWAPRPEDEAGEGFTTLVAHWHEIAADDYEVPAEVAALRGKGCDAAKDIFRILRFVDDESGLTTGQLQDVLKEGHRVYAKSTFLAGRALLIKKGMCDTVTGARIALSVKENAE